MPIIINDATALTNFNVCIPSGDANQPFILADKPAFSAVCVVVLFCSSILSNSFLYGDLLRQFTFFYLHFTIPIYYSIAISKLQQLKSTNIVLLDVRCSQLIYPMLQRVCKLLLKKGRQRVIIFMYFKKHKEKR